MLTPAGEIKTAKEKAMQLVLLICVGWAAAAADQGPQNLRCEWKTSPARVSDPCPDFFWEAPSQSALELMVADSPEGFQQPLWRCQQRSSLPIVEYAGPPLVPNKPYCWKIRLWDAQGKPCPIRRSNSSRSTQSRRRTTCRASARL